jgi:hypothetical protein
MQKFKDPIKATQAQINHLIHHPHAWTFHVILDPSHMLRRGKMKK